MVNRGKWCANEWWVDRCGQVPVVADSVGDFRHWLLVPIAIPIPTVHVHPGHQLWVASATEGQSGYVGDYVSDYVGGHSSPGCVVIILTGATPRADRQRCGCAIIWHMVIWCRSCDGESGVW